jgi:two-component system OmpR family response regulator
MPGDAFSPLPNPRVLLIEDNPDVAATFQKFIERAGMRTAWADTGARAIELKQSFMPDVVLVDLELPDTSGVELIGWLTRLHDCGIIIVSGRDEEAERVVGLELGADDYVAKPPQLRELVARIRAVHRRSHLRSAARRPPPVASVPEAAPVQVGPWRVDPPRRTVTDAAGRPLPITAAEFTALLELLLARGEPVSRERLSEVALRRPWRAEDRSIDQLIFTLRRKLGDGEEGGRIIQTVRGAGYVLAAVPRPASA